MRFKILIILLIICLNLKSSSTVHAQKQKGPYEAVVEQNGTYVRSGPGKRYYPTMQLKRGTRVTVYRHDPGGWYMIAPPRNSFSWVNAKYVQMVKQNIGEITANRVTVNVGTVFGDTKDVWQRTLSTGDRIHILGEKLLQSSTKKIKYYKIAPPRGEWRWISGRAVAPENSVARKNRENNPYEIPVGLKKSEKMRKRYEEDLTFKEDKKLIESNIKGVNQNSPNQKLLAEQLSQLNKLDSDFRNIIRKETAEWDFQTLSQSYQQLRKDSQSIAFSNKLKLRFDALNRYGKIKAQYDDFLQITRETTLKEARLLDLQNKQFNGSTISGVPVPSPEIEGSPETNIVPEPESEVPVENNEIQEEQSSIPAYPNPLNGPVLQGPSVSNPLVQDPAVPQLSSNKQIPSEEIMPSEPIANNQASSNLPETQISSNNVSNPQQFANPQNGFPNQAVTHPQYAPQPTQGRVQQPVRHMTGIPIQENRAPGLLGRLGLIPPRRRLFSNQGYRAAYPPQQISNQQNIQPGQRPQSDHPAFGQPVLQQGQIPTQPNYSQPVKQTGAMQQPPVLQQPQTTQHNAASPSGKSPHALLDGAGIVQRTPAWRPGSPRYVLTNQKGNILSYIQSNNGLNLEQHVGHAVGVQGHRSHRSDLQSDLIQINHLTPVNLK
jgi:uncharacterized protein YraI